MDSFISNSGSEPKLLQVVIWIDAKVEQNVEISVQVGSRAPLTQQGYIVMTKIFFYDLVCDTDFPIFMITYNSLKMPIDSSCYPLGTPNQIGQDDVILHFTLNYIASMKALEQKYCASKEQVEKLARASGLSNFVRTESQFLSIYERNQEIQEIKVAQIEEEKYQRHICNQILKLKKTKFDLKTMFLLVAIFVIFGYLMQAIDGRNLPRKRHNYKSKKVIQNLKKKSMKNK